MRYIKALTKTIKQMDKDYRYLLYGISLLSSGMFIAITSACFNLMSAEVIGAITTLVGLGFMIKPLWDDTKDDIRKFFKRVKENVE